jgi:hypothetical protein
LRERERAKEREKKKRDRERERVCCRLYEILQKKLQKHRNTLVRET